MKAVCALELSAGQGWVGEFKDPILLTEYGPMNMFIMDPIFRSSIECGKPQIAEVKLSAWVKGLSKLIEEEHKIRIVGTTKESVATVMKTRSSMVLLNVSTDVMVPSKWRVYQTRVGTTGFKRDYCLDKFDTTSFYHKIAREVCTRWSDAQIYGVVFGSIGCIIMVPWLYVLFVAMLSKCSSWAEFHRKWKYITICTIVFKNHLPKGMASEMKALQHKETYLEGGTGMVNKSYKKAKEATSEHGIYYRSLVKCGMWITPIWYFVILLAFVMMIPGLIFGVFMKILSNCTKQKHGFWCYVMMFGVVLYSPHECFDYSSSNVSPYFKSVGATIKMNSVCNGDACVADFLQTFPLTQVEGFYVESKIVNSDGEQVGTLRHTVEKVDVVSTLIYDHSIYSVSISVDMQVLDRDDDCDDDSDEWDCRSYSGIQLTECLIWHNELKGGEATAGDINNRYRADDSATLFSPMSVVAKCPKGTSLDDGGYCCGTDGQRWRIDWWDQDPRKPIGRVYRVDNSHADITVKIDLVLMGTTTTGTMILDSIGTSQSVGDHLESYMMDWNGDYGMEGENVGCMYLTPDAIDPDVCVSGIVGYSTATRMLRAVGETWNTNGTYVPEVYALPDVSYTWGTGNDWRAKPSSNAQWSWNRQDFEGLGNLITSVSNCDYSIEDLPNSAMAYKTDRCTLFGPATKEACESSNWRWIEAESWKPNQKKLRLTNCVESQISVTTVLKDFEYTLEGASLNILDPRKLTWTMSGCWGYSQRLQIVVMKDVAMEDGAVLMKKGSVDPGSMIWITGTELKFNVTTEVDVNIWFYGVFEDNNIEVRPSGGTVPKCDTYSPNDNPGNGPPGPPANFPWWGYLLIAIGVILLIMILVLVVWCACRAKMSQSVMKIVQQEAPPQAGGGWAKYAKRD